MVYEKIGPNHPSYERLKSVKDIGEWMCDSVDHSELEYCSNPECFKSKNPPDFWDKYNKEFLNYLNGVKE